MSNAEKMLEIKDLSVIYKTDLETVYAVNGVTFSLEKGATLGLVGETGAGKTTLALTLMRLLPERTGKVTSGSITFEGEDIINLPEAQMCKIRGDKIAMIFQDPMTSLNPVLTVEDQILEKQDLDADYDLLTGASFSMKNMIGLKDDVSAQRKDSNHKKQRYYGYTEDYGYGITGWLQVVVEDGKIVKAAGPAITAQCLRVPVSDGHTAAVFVSFKGEKPSVEQIKAEWASFQGRAQELNLPSAPKQFLHYFEEPDRPQAKLDRELEGGMAISLGRLREDTQYDYKFVGLSHNTLRGAAGGAVLLAELLCAEGYMDR